MVKKRNEMRGVQLNPRTGHIYLNESYEKFLRTMHGRKFARSFTASVNDLLDSALLETLDDMKKVIRYYEWRMETKDRAIGNLTKYAETLKGSLENIRQYAEGLEERFARSRARVESLEEAVKDTKMVVATAKVIPKNARSASDILTELRGQVPKDKGVPSVAAVRADGEIEADDVEADITSPLERPSEMAAVEGRDIEAHLGMGARLDEAEIGADDLDISPQILAIKDKIDKVKGMEALHSDEEIERIFSKKEEEE